MQTATRVEELDRDLSFAPSDPSKARKFTAEQIEHYNEHGYLFPIDIFDQKEADDLRAYFDDLIEKFRADGGNIVTGIADFHTHCRTIYDVATHPRILEYVRDIIGDNVVCWHTHAFAKEPGESRAVPWHQDATYWPLTPSRTITVWLAIDDSDTENGGLQIIPGTHKGVLDYRDIDKKATGHVLSKQILDIERYGDPITIELKAGQASIHPDLMAHGSSGNASTRRRCGLTLRYCPADVHAHMNKNKDAIIVLGEDASGHWANVPRPDGEYQPKNKG